MIDVPAVTAVILKPYKINHIPQEKRITARKVVTNPGYATLRQTIQAVLSSPEVATYYIENRGEGNWCSTVVRYDVDGNGNEKNEWFEGPLEFSDRLARPTKFYKSGRLYIPNTGFVKAVRDGDRVITYDIYENGGFARETTNDKQEAEESYKENGLDPRLVSKQWRQSQGKHGLVPVSRCSYVDGGPLDVDAGWNFGNFGSRGPDIGALPVSGSQ